MDPGKQDNERDSRGGSLQTIATGSVFPIGVSPLHFPRSRVARQASRGVTRPFQMRRLSPHAVVG